MNRRSFLTSASAASLAGCATAPGRTLDFALSGDIDAAVAHAMRRDPLVPGLAVAVFTRAGTYARGFGAADLDTGERNTPDTLFNLASSAKPLTALALSILHERGELDLEQTLSAFAPDAPFPSAVRPNEVRLRNLITHTSGMDNIPLGFRLAFTGDHDPATLWRLLAATQMHPRVQLGQFRYTNIGYNIATLLTGRRRSVRWQDMLQTEVFDPAGMRRAVTSMTRARTQGWSIARPHVIGPGPRTQRTYVEKTDSTMHSAGGVLLSANDALRWLELMIEDGRVGARQATGPTAVQATRARLAEVGADYSFYHREAYGLGWYLGPHRGEQLVHHFGGFAGFRAHVSYMPERGVGVAAFVNSTGSDAIVDAIANYVYDRVGGHADALQAFDAALDQVIHDRDAGIASTQADVAARAGRSWTLTRPRSAYAGTYENDQFGRIEVIVNGEDLILRWGVLEAQAEPFTAPDSLRIEFVPDLLRAPVLFTGVGPEPEALSLINTTFARI